MLKHGFGPSDPEEYARLAGESRVTDSEGFEVVWPNSPDGANNPTTPPPQVHEEFAANDPANREAKDSVWYIPNLGGPNATG